MEEIDGGDTEDADLNVEKVTPHMML